MQQVNLLDASLAPIRKRLGANQLALAWLGFSVFLVLVSIWQSASLWWLQDEEMSTRAEVQRVREANSVYRANTEPPIALEAQVAELSKQQDQQALLVDLLQRQQSLSFSPYLAALSDARVDRLWLSEISIVHGATREINLKGATSDASLVPVMLRNLSEQQQFRGQRFRHVEITALPDASLSEFIIVSPDGAVSG
ncbi:MAG: PilN domain-containing protein [bacterium]